MSVADARAALPRYVEIRQALEAAIRSGQWPPGHRVPSEHELMESYGCSRMTVNKALSALAEAGLVTRRRRSGTVVAQPGLAQPVLEIHDIPAEVRASGLPYRHEVQRSRRRAATLADARRLGVDRGTPVLAVRCRHFAGTEPFASEERLINLAAVPAAETADFAAVPPGSWMLAEIPWTEAEHVIRAEPAGDAEAADLALAPGASCLVVERRTWQAGLPLTWVTLTYPGARHRLVARFGPQQA